MSHFIEMLVSIYSTEHVEYILYSSIECDGLKIAHNDCSEVLSP